MLIRLHHLRVFDLHLAGGLETHTYIYSLSVPALQAVCSWPLCLFHSRKPPHALKSCKGCSEVQYCGKQCQLSGWKLNDHKTRCRRSKDSE
ncbi:hypothetical protein PENSPDRAFT_251931 [Peniophora sp. CONT]|nr:hypothetical protein PENSPDRAFT_251931 [Peniophora sp. CONT]